MVDLLVPDALKDVAEQLVEILSSDPNHFAGELPKADNVIWGIDFRKGREPEYVASPSDCA
jgi:hypothetical protein